MFLVKHSIVEQKALLFEVEGLFKGSARFAAIYCLISYNPNYNTAGLGDPIQLLNDAAMIEGIAVVGAKQPVGWAGYC